MSSRHLRSRSSTARSRVWSTANHRRHRPRLGFRSHPVPDFESLRRQSESAPESVSVSTLIASAP